MIAIVGATASGKSALALALARRRTDVELVSVDSMQVYRRMDIGTAKPTKAEQAEVPHHLIDLADASQDYGLSLFQAAGRQAIADVESRGKLPVLVGGTGLYVRALVDDFDIPGQYPEVRAELEADPDTEALHRRLAELDSAAAARMEPSNRRRIVRALEVSLGSGRPFSSYGPGLTAYPAVATAIVGIDRPRPNLDRRIEERYQKQLNDGFLDEVKGLLRSPGGLSRTAGQALGYKELALHLGGEINLSEAVDLANRRTRRFARRQQRWFRRDPRITWFEPDANSVAVLDDVLQHCDKKAAELS